VWYTRHIDDNPAQGPYRVQLNAVGNRFLTRPSFPYGQFLIDLLQVSANSLYVHDNTISRWPLWSDYQLFYCCNDFAQLGPNTEPGSALRRSERHPFAAVQYLPGSVLQQQLPGGVGALPADPLDRRWAASARSGVFPAVDYGTPLANDSFDLDFDPAAPPAPPSDSDADGMPDAFEQQHVALGLSPTVFDANGTQLSLPLLGVAGYTNLEVWLHRRALELAVEPALFRHGFEGS
jgi:hypothetical protein